MRVKIHTEQLIMTKSQDIRKAYTSILLACTIHAARRSGSPLKRRPGLAVSTVTLREHHSMCMLFLRNLKEPPHDERRTITYSFALKAILPAVRGVDMDVLSTAAHTQETR